MADQRGSWFRVYSRQIMVHPKFLALSHAELGAWLTLRSEADLLGGVPFPNRHVAILALRCRRGISERVLDRLIELRLLDLNSDGTIAFHDLADHDRPIYPSDARERVRERVARHRAGVTSGNESVTNGVTKPRTREQSRGEETREESEQSGPPLPNDDDPLTTICQLLMTTAPIEDKKYRAKVDDQTKRYGAEWVSAAYRQAFHDFTSVGERPSRWDLLHHADKHLAGWVRAEEMRREDAAKVEEQPRKELSAEEIERQELMRKAIGIWVRGGRRGEVPTNTADLPAWLEANGAGA